MDKPEALAICRECLATWADKLAGELATPVLLLGVKHGENSLVLCVPKDAETNAIRTLLMAALRALPSNGSHA